MVESLSETWIADTEASPGLDRDMAVADLDELEFAVAREKARAGLFAGRERPVAFGRYVLLKKVGSGGMGVVYEAYDPKLDRKVALKVLRADLEAGLADHERLLAEAQALGKLAHPNVVAVHDVGTVGESDAVFLAMEYVDGRTMREWLAEERPSVDEALSMMVAAGRGLSAAHASGLVHRDFKPENVMIGRDGRARVMDFGLARTVQVSPRSLDDETEDTIARGTRASLTQTGRVVGTPAYMAPEQFDAGQVGPRSDQFGFCVALWEALHRQRPFSGDSAQALCEAMTHGHVGPASPDRRVPGWLRAALIRGLDIDPEARWPSMDTLLDALERGRAHARWRRARNVALALGVAGLAAMGGRAVLHSRALDQCARDGERVATLWPGRADAVRNGILTTGLSYAGSTAERVEPRLDAWAAAWSTARREACVQAEVEATLSPTLYRRARGCLDVQMAGATAVVDALAAAEDAALYDAAKVIGRRPDPSECLDAARLERGSWPDDADWQPALEIRSRLAAVHASNWAPDVVDTLRALVQDAEALGWVPLIAEARAQLGIELDGTAPVEATDELRRAYFDAGRVGADAIALRAAARLAFVHGSLRAQPELGQWWLDQAQMLLERRGLDDPSTEARLAGIAGGIARERADYDAAYTAFAKALAIRERELPATHPDIALTLNALGRVEYRRGNQDSAQRMFERAAEQAEAMLGPDHPDVAHALNNLANVYFGRRSFDAARPLYERAIEVRTRAVGTEDSMVAAAMTNLASLHKEQGRPADAVALYQRALAIKEATLGPESPRLVMTLEGLCAAQRVLGALDESLASCTRAAAIAEQGYGVDHPSFAGSLRILSAIQAARGDDQLAFATCARGLAIAEAALGDEHPDVAEFHSKLSALHSKLGDLDKALQSDLRALKILQEALGHEHPRVVTKLGEVSASHRALGQHAEADRLDEKAAAITRRD
ncbi:MAG: serine/threonine-protein kinase [Myxococcota bacterium]